MRNTTEPRKYDEEKRKTIPETDVTATYKIVNKGFSPLPLTITDPSRTEMQTMTMGARGSRVIDGNRMTDLIWELESQGKITVTRVPNS